MLVVALSAFATASRSRANAALTAKQAQLSNLQRELDSEVGGMMKIDHQPSQHTLGTDFKFHILDERVDKATVRCIKIQCPGVRHSDVSISIIFNGCIVSINRRAEQGVEPIEWTQKFQFYPSEGLFEFKEDQAALDRGYLTLIFRAYVFQNRSFRFPSHFNLSESDGDCSWNYLPGAAGPEPPLSIDAVPDAFTAPGRLEMTGAAQDSHAVAAVRKAETQASAIESDDFEAARAKVATAAAQRESGCNNTVPPSKLTGCAVTDDVEPEMEGAPAAEEASPPGGVKEEAAAAEEAVAAATLPDAKSTVSSRISEGFEHVELAPESLSDAAEVCDDSKGE